MYRQRGGQGEWDEWGDWDGRIYIIDTMYKT